ncbi:MAG TPA: hypothetical protein VFZ91_03630 [Allosphingosinicella sp.]
MEASRLLRWFTLLALLLAPLGMIGGAPAVAHYGAVAAGHCADMENPADAPSSVPMDCTTACSALPAQADGIAVRPLLPCAPEPAALTVRLHSLEPEAATPPPRIS